MKRPTLHLFAFLFVSFAAAQEAQVTPARSTIKVRLQGATGFDVEKEVEIKEALLINVISVFIGKSGFVRLRSGVATSYVFLSTQELGCTARVEPPKQTIGNAAKKKSRQTNTAQSEPAVPIVGFVPKDERDFEIRAIGFFMFDPKEMEKDATALPFFVKVLEGKTGNSSTIHFDTFVVGALHQELKDGRSVQFKSGKAGASPVFSVFPKDGEWYVKLGVEDKKLGVNAEVRLKKCPTLESIYIEPKK